MWKRVSEFVLGETPRGRLPARILATVAGQQVNSERLIGWVQLFLVTVFAVLYAVSPKMARHVDFQPVPWILGVYFAFTATKLFFAHRRPLPDWVTMASVAMDIALLMILIWTFHIQYMQQAAFYLKVPTLLYVFIFIALRALRFEAKYVLTAGLTAAAGWAIMLWYAIAGEMNIGSLVTRDYVEYMTSNRILIGAEIDKILSILMVTAILTIAVKRAQRVLCRAVAESTVAQDLSKFVAAEIADRIATADKAIQPGDGESRTASVIFTDIEGFSTVSEKMSAAELAATLNDYFGAMSEAIDRHGGTIAMFQGDAMLITFNTTTPDPDHAANALKTALAIREIADRRTFGNGLRLKTRCGVNTGEIAVGAVGAKDRLVFTVHGDEVNVAARLEPLNKQYGTYILATERTCAEAGPGFRTRRLGEITVRGRATPTVVLTIDAGPKAG